MLGSAILAFALLGQTDKAPPDAAALVEKLGAASFAEREAAKSLEGLGSKALPALRSALKSKDAEVRARARSMINKIQSNLLIQATPVRLDFQDATLEEVLRSFSKQAGFNVSVNAGGPMNLGATSARVSLRDSKPVPFWKAVDRVFEAAGADYQPQPGFPPGMMRGQSGPAPDLILTLQPDLVGRPRSEHGPFQVSVLSLNYQSQVSFLPFGRMGGLFRGANVALAKAARKGARPRLESPPKGNSPPGAAKDAEPAKKEPPRTVQFHVQLQIVTEPRMTVGQVGPVQIVEAVDDRGNSLLPVTAGDEPRFGPMNAGFAMPGGPFVTAVAPLRRPESPGKLIKTLRGSLDVSVVARQPDPLVIPLENAAGKTFQNDDLHVSISAVVSDQAGRQDNIELAIDEIDQLFPDESGAGAELGARMLPAMRSFQRFIAAGNGAQSPIQLIDSQGQNLFHQLKFDPDTGRLKLTVPQMQKMREMKEIRISNVVHARTKVVFDFHDLPMP